MKSINMDNSIYALEEQKNRKIITNSYIHMLNAAYPDYIFNGDIDHMNGKEVFVITALNMYTGFESKQIININYSSNCGVIKDIFNQFDFNKI